jgi:hypothetical protein
MVEDSTRGTHPYSPQGSLGLSARTPSDVHDTLNFGGGRKKGSTLQASATKTNNLINTHKFAAKTLSTVYLQQTSHGKLPNGTLSVIIKEATEKYDLEKGQLKLIALKERFRRGIATYANGLGLNSPMMGIEKHLVSITLCRAAIRCPHTVPECIELANSLITDSVTQLELVKWKKEVLGKKIREERAHTVGYKWWHNFVRCHKVRLSIGKAARFNMKRNEWCKKENFKTMYDFIYNELAECRFSDEWDDAQMLDRKGNIAHTIEDMYGQPTKITLLTLKSWSLLMK